MPTTPSFCPPISFFALSRVALGLALLAGCNRQDPAAAPAPASGSPTVAAPVTTVPPAAAAADIAKVKGRWLRPDGGYVLALTTIGADGRAEAGYFNPNPIKVGWATVGAEGAEIRVKVELRDENYPGCLYKLTYAADKDRLVGTYFQAQMQQTYDVEFVREP